MSRSNMMRLGVAIALVTILVPCCKTNRSHQSGSPGQETNNAAVPDARGDTLSDGSVEFDRSAATIHFFLLPEGGIITVEANDPADSLNRDRIRMHLQRAAAQFADGDFHASQLVHGEMPPGVPVMQRLKSEISYQYKEIVSGGEIDISTDNRQAQRAIQQFLRYQIRQHQTGDPVEVRHI